MLQNRQVWKKALTFFFYACRKDFMMENFICLGLGALLGMMISVVVIVILMEPRDRKEPPTKDEWKLM